MQIVAAPLESRRFGRSIGRLDLRGDERAVEVASAVAEAPYDLVIATVPTVGAQHPGSLSTAPVTARIMEVRTTWGGTVDPCRATTLTEVVRWDVTHERLVVRVFAGYRNHMSRRDDVDPASVGSGYAEWAGRHVGVEGAALLTLDRSGHGEVEGFAAVSTSEPGTTIVDLAGVVPEARGRGVYSRLLDGVEEWAAARGSARIRIATQMDNLAPQRAWARRGWLPERSEWIVHLERADVTAVSRSSARAAASPPRA